MGVNAAAPVPAAVTPDPDALAAAALAVLAVAWAAGLGLPLADPAEPPQPDRAPITATPITAPASLAPRATVLPPVTGVPPRCWPIGPPPRPVPDFLIFRVTLAGRGQARAALR